MYKAKNRLPIIISLFIVILVFFNYSLLREFVGRKETLSDNVITELIAENGYRNIIYLKNPFIIDSMFYPFTINISLNDPAISNSIFFFFLRPFFSAHQTLIIITLLGFFLNNFLMYILLRKLKINQFISLLFSLVFSFTPFLSHKVVGHYTYIHIYLFPLAYLIINQFFETRRKKNKFFLAISFGLFLALVLLSNFYYFFTIILGLLVFMGYFLFCYPKKTFEFFISNIKYLTISVIIYLLVLIPWFVSVYQLLKTGNHSDTPGFGGTVTLSADVLSFFTPSEYNPIYKKMFSFLSLRIPYFTKYNDFFLNSWERFVYPGIIILGSYFLIVLLKIFKKIPLILWNKVKGYFYVSLVFAILTLGPFLKIFNRWSINLDGVAVVFPLPFLLLRYVPGLSTLRAPSRFIPAFVFLACIVVAYLINYLTKKIKGKKFVLIMIMLFFIFFVDQFYVIPTELNQEIPINIYNTLKGKPYATVLEIPFTVRDGFRYIGFVHAIQPMAGQLIHKKPIIGGYMARVPGEVFDYYKRLKLIGYLAKTIDKGNYMPLKEKPSEINLFPYPYPINTAINEIKSLNIKYVILKDNEKYSNYLIGLFKQLGFAVKLKDIDYLLLEK